MSRERLLLVLTVVAVAALTGCAVTGRRVHVDQVPFKVFQARAKHSVKAWERTAAMPPWQDKLVILTEPMIVDMSDATLTPALKLALFLHNMSVDPNVPKIKSSRGEVTFANGDTLPVGLVSTANALSKVTAQTCMPAPCAAVITGAKLGAVSVVTNRGMARVPAWQFRVRG